MRRRSKTITLTENQLAWLYSRGGRNINDVFLYKGKPHTHMRNNRVDEPFELPEDKYLIVKRIKNGTAYYTHVRYVWETV